MNTSSESRQKAGMSWSWRIAAVAGIPIYLNGTSLLLLATILEDDWPRARTLGAAMRQRAAAVEVQA